MKSLKIFSVAALLVLAGADNGAQTRCATCPDKTDVSLPNLNKDLTKDTLMAQADSLIAMQDSLLVLLKKQYKKACRPILRRSEEIQLISGRWRYDWYYDKNGFSFVIKHKL